MYSIEPMAKQSNHKEFYAQFAHASYNVGKQVEHSDVNGFKLDSDLSSQEHQCWVDKSEGTPDNIIISIRGTQNIRDGVTDIFLLLDGLSHTSRYKQLVTFYKKVLQKYTSSKKKPYIVATGHSLGGALASLLTENNDSIDECHIFNPGASLDNVRNDMIAFLICKFTSKPKRCKLRKRLFVHKTFGDLLTNYSHITNSNQTWDKPNQINTHTIQNFLRNDNATSKSLDKLSMKQLKENMAYLEVNGLQKKNRESLLKDLKQRLVDNPSNESDTIQFTQSSGEKTEEKASDTSTSSDVVSTGKQRSRNKSVAKRVTISEQTAE